MTSRVVAIRLSSEDVKFLRAHGKSPSEAAKEGIQGIIGRLRFEESAEWFRRHPPRNGLSFQGAVRVMRKSRNELESGR